MFEAMLLVQKVFLWTLSPMIISMMPQNFQFDGQFFKFSFILICLDDTLKKNLINDITCNRSYAYDLNGWPSRRYIETQEVRATFTGKR